MPITVNLRHLESHDVHLEGEIPVAELDLDPHDEVVRVGEPLAYDLEVQKLEESLLVTGHLTLPLSCVCVRCLKPFRYRLRLKDWTCHLPLTGEDAVSVNNDSADLTPYIREDILLEFPQHPLCDPECGGLPGVEPGNGSHAISPGNSEVDSSAWAELNKLKF